jgi:hypothetical protein
MKSHRKSIIVSASRRTDIPACYSDWFLKRLEEGYALTPYPFDRKRLRHVELSPGAVDCVVFWTKNPAPMLPELSRIEAMGYSFYFLYTLTPYDQTIETGLPLKTELEETFAYLSRLIGMERVVWHYDPVFIDSTHEVS